VVRRRLSDDPDVLLAAARRGDHDALEALLRSVHDRMAAVARRMLRDPGDAADCTQEALIRVVRGLAGFDGRSSFSTWCHRIVATTALDELRRRGRRPVTVPETDREPLSTESTPEQASLDALALADIDSALARLPEEFRQAVVLSDVADLDYPTIAEMLEVPVGTVKSRVARGRAQLRNLLGNPTESGGRRMGEE
jgi:RNA polymerase sigma-70 factor (ECF subfamily)